MYRFLFLFITFLLGTNAFAQMEFVQNKGQWDKRVNYKADFNTGAFFLEKNGFTVLLNKPEDVKTLSEIKHGIRSPKSPKLPTLKDFIFHSFAYNVSFLGAAINPERIPDKPLPTYNNYFLGNDKNKWAGDCKIYNAVTYKNIYPNIDVRYYSTQNKLKYDFIVHPGGNPAAIALRYDGGVKLSIKNKSLIIGTSVGNVIELEPYSYQTNATVKADVVTRYVIKDNVVSFAVSKYDPAATLIIDPQLIFSSFTGSTADNWGYTATPGSDGSFFAGGVAFSNGYPASPGAFQTTYQGSAPGSYTTYDISVFKFSANGTQRLYATYLGGSKEEQPHSMIADAAGNLIIAGRSNSPNYPLLTTIPATGAGYDIVITKLNATGTALLGSVKIGGSGDDGVNIKDKEDQNISGDTSLRRNYGDDARSEVILDATNDVVLASYTQSNNFPVFPISSALQPTFGGGLQDGVVMKLTPNLNSFIFSTYFGGNDDDACFVAAVNPITNNLYVGGATKSNNLPGNTNGTIHPNFLGRIDGFVTEIQPNGTSIFKTTYIGTASVDGVYGLKFDKFGYPYIMGTTTGVWPITSNVVYSVPNSKQFIAKLQPDLSAYVYSTNFGTSNNPTTPNISPIAFLVDRCENVYVSGWGGDVNTGYSNSGTTGLPEINQITSLPAADGSDFYFFVLKKDAQAQLFGSHFGQDGGVGDHVDGGTSRFDANGVIYQAMCANCSGSFTGTTFPTYPLPPSPNLPWSNANLSSNCNLAAVKIDMNFAGVATTIQSSILGVLNDTVGCEPVLVNFRDTLQKGVKYYWNFDTLASPNNTDTITLVANASHLYNLIGVYTVRLIAEDSSTCNIRDTSYINITISDRKVTPKFTAKRIQPCTVNKYEFTNLSFNFDNTTFSQTSFVWDYGDSSPKDTANLNPVRTHTYASLGTYFVTLTVIDPRFCNAPISDTVKIVVEPNVTAITDSIIPACAPFTASFKNKSLNSTTWLWEIVDAATGNIINTFTDFEPTFTFTNAGTYKYRLIASNPNTCNLKDTTKYISISFGKFPNAAFTWSPNPPEPNAPVKFTNLSTDATNYLWEFGDGESSTAFEPIHEYNKTGSYNVVLYAFNKSICSDTFPAIVPVIINPLLDVPNAFTPGKFGTNSVVYVRGYGIGKMEWRIYNRWGELVFKSSNKREGWDGFYKGKLQPMDVYTYTLDVEFVDGQKTRKTGDISLLR
jgi:gliding motility-associated-like protein